MIAPTFPPHSPLPSLEPPQQEPPPALALEQDPVQPCEQNAMDRMAAISQDFLIARAEDAPKPTLKLRDQLLVSLFDKDWAGRPLSYKILYNPSPKNRFKPVPVDQALQESGLVNLTVQQLFEDLKQASKNSPHAGHILKEIKRYNPPESLPRQAQPHQERGRKRRAEPRAELQFVVRPAFRRLQYPQAPCGWFSVLTPLQGQVVRVVPFPSPKRQMIHSAGSSGKPRNEAG